MRKIFVITFLSAFLFFLAFNFAQAGGTNCPQGLVPCGTTDCPCELCDLFVMLDRIIDFFLFKIVPPVGILMIAIGGIMFITAGGNLQQVATGKKILTSTILGIAIIFLAWLLVFGFLSLIGAAEWTGLRNWWEIICQ